MTTSCIQPHSLESSDTTGQNAASIDIEAMGRKRSRSHASNSSFDSESEIVSKSSKRSGNDKGKGREHERYRPNKDEEIDAHDDFYTRNKEFRHWLLHGRSKSKQFAQLESNDQRAYFKRFVKRWNRGKLDRAYYDGSLLHNNGGPDSASNKQENPASEGAGGAAPTLGPSRPTMEDLLLQQEVDQDEKAFQKDASRAESKRSMREAKQDERESRPTGRDRVQEKRHEKRQGNREMAAAKEQGDLEFGEDFLIGGTSSSFAEAVRRRDMSKQGQARQRKLAEKAAFLDEKRTDLQKKENSTMEMVGLTVTTFLRMCAKIR